MESRYARQEVLPEIGKAGQKRLAEARVALVGMGALGSASADVLTRSGVGAGAGFLRLIDDDVVAPSNLQRCSLYDEADVEAGTPKAQAAAKRLAAINSAINLEPHVVRLTKDNIIEYLAGVDLILDGSDNFELRYLLNEAADTLGIPWIYTGVLGTVGMLMPITQDGPCFCCLNPVQPEPGSYHNATTFGVLAATTRTAATLQANLAIMMLIEANETAQAALVSERTSHPQDTATLAPSTACLLQLDVWSGTFDSITITKDPDCPVCGKHQYSLLED